MLHGLGEGRQEGKRVGEDRQLFLGWMQRARTPHADALAARALRSAPFSAFVWGVWGTGVLVCVKSVDG